MVDTWWPNHDEVQAVTAVKRLRGKRVAVCPLHTFVLGVSQHQQICFKLAETKSISSQKRNADISSEYVQVSVIKISYVIFGYM
jgi:hypothetical protein